jgi:hypothetical protein
MGGDRQIARLRAQAKRAEELAAKLESNGPDGELTERVIARLRSESQCLRGLITFFEFAAQHEGHRR